MLQRRLVPMAGAAKTLLRRDQRSDRQAERRLDKLRRKGREARIVARSSLS